MTHEEIQSAYRTYQDSRGTPAEGDAADAFVAAVLSYEDNLPRALLDLAFWVACGAKKAEKPRRPKSPGIRKMEPRSEIRPGSSISHGRSLRYAGKSGVSRKASEG